MPQKYRINSLFLLLLTISLSGCLSDSVSKPTRLAEPAAQVKQQKGSIKPLYAELYVDPVPEKARIRVMNIGPKFAQGMRLAVGRYQIEVTAPGYKTYLQWITLEAGKMRRLKVELAPQ